MPQDACFSTNHRGLRRLKVEPDASACQLLTNLFIVVADVQKHIAEEFVSKKVFPLVSLPHFFSLSI